MENLRCRQLVAAEQQEPLQDEQQSRIAKDLQSIMDCLDSLDPGDPAGVAASAKTLLRGVQDKLKPWSGTASRAKGGWQFRPMCILDSVLLADNLRHLTAETDLLPEVVQQHLSLHCVCGIGIGWLVNGGGRWTLEFEFELAVVN